MCVCVCVAKPVAVELRCHATALIKFYFQLRLWVCPACRKSADHVFFYFQLRLWVCPACRKSADQEMEKKEPVIEQFWVNITYYHKVPKFLDAGNFAVIHLKFKQKAQTLRYFVKRCKRNSKQ